MQVNGASGAENYFHGRRRHREQPVVRQSRQNTVFEYLQEVQVKTGGIEAQYGGALGGVISAVTKSGGNTFHGEGHYYYTGQWLSATAVPRIHAQPGGQPDGLQLCRTRSRSTIVTRLADRSAARS